ncbi:flagellar hook-associated protein FlgK [Desulfovibrio mangrovi]|uniref:flagellar hook-associated protein FlgK n=1 Tax=Desulfovibrio mangrovi TaxID=2976983 RepID=UPI0022455992|nr:flagellar hook-associated protein FlgK [Desulfovibrio mangrovi]UZP68781.1 flagellar hook-associated protein FlgK [Desulfovibrio mangrovi]
MTINGIYSLATQALMNAQVGISVTGDNIANADVQGYSRKTVTYETADSIRYRSLYLGTGADVQEIARHYNYYVEKQYLASNSETSYWGQQAESLSSVEELFNESDDYGISTALDQFFTSLSALAQDASSDAYRTELTEYATTLADQLRSLNSSLDAAREAADAEIADQVDEANDLLSAIAAYNATIVGNRNDATLQDAMDVAVRELSSLLDVNVIYQENGQYTVLTAEGQTLVDGSHAYTLAYEGPQSTKELTSGSTYDGEVYFDGTGANELTIDFVTSGPTDGSAGAATFRVSVDGGRTWLTDDNGNELTYTAGDYDNRVTIEGVSVWFGTAGDANATATTNVSAGDEFTIVPKSGVYWYKTTSDKVNITPYADSSSDSGNRLSGGSIAGLLQVRDQSITAYMEEMDAFASELIWQMNYQHSQGAGTEHYTNVQSVNAVNDASIPLANTQLAYADKLTTGGLSIALYDEDTGNTLGVTALDFSSIVPPGLDSFDPTQHSLNDVAAAINATFSGQLTASVTDGRMSIQAADGVEFEFAGDTTGILAATGINTFFSGDGITDIQVDSRLLADSGRINASVVDGTGLVASGDNTNALAMAGLAEADVELDTIHSSSSQTLSEHLHSLVSKVGTDMDTASRSYTYSSAVATQLDTLQQEVSGVNLDEEYANLTRYQQSYQAAAQLIQTANEMFDVILSLKS